MTEFEAATIIYQNASLTAQYLQAAVAGVVGLLQAVVVGWGLRQMTKMGERREQRHAERHAETMQQQAAAMRAAEQQHQATMEVLRQQGEALRQQNEAFRQQGEALGQQGEALRQQGEALRQQGEALGVLIERTAPPAAGH